MPHFVALGRTRGYERLVGRPSEYLCWLLEEKGLWIKEMVARTGLSRATVDRHVMGRIEPSFDQREKYATALGMTSEEFERGWQEFAPPSDLRAAAKKSEPTTGKKRR
jgi:transcriptional regulator with XRE-family HTH domain